MKIDKYMDKIENSECTESDIDWDNDIDWKRVPVDTPVEVGDYVDDLFECYFACYIPNSTSKYFVFDNGYNRIKACGLMRWKYCRLSNEEDIEKYRKKQ